MSLLKKLPRMDCDREKLVKQPFLDRAAKGEDHTVLNAEFRVAMESAKKALEKECEAVAIQNTLIFLAHPKEVIEELDIERRSTFDLGEMFLFAGIATATCKRFGKGFLRGKGTDYPHTVSGFKVTAKIDGFELIEEQNCSNDKHAKERMMASVVATLAYKIANDEALTSN